MTWEVCERLCALCRYFLRWRHRMLDIPPEERTEHLGLCNVEDVSVLRSLGCPRWNVDGRLVDHTSMLPSLRPAPDFIEPMLV